MLVVIVMGLAQWYGFIDESISVERESFDSYDRRVPVAQCNNTYLSSIENNKIADTNDSNEKFL